MLVTKQSCHSQNVPIETMHFAFFVLYLDVMLECGFTRQAVL